ncbi:transcription repressor OFP13-like [Phragmites australis]|uniref:transcription repressor OFP13-like n=1 Tax=Phragmites australis TaxID=29695 RepID=UPI002D78D0F6|nr:transcription repressor OFP13-like [Phragmites australis]
MGKKGGIASIFSKSKLAADSPSPPWPWPSCATNPQTASFRQQKEEDQPCTTAGGSSAVIGRLPRKAAGDMYKTVNSVYFDSADSYSEDDDGEADDNVLDDGSFSTTTVSEEWSEAVIRSLGRTSTDRFFFDLGPPPASNSILAASPSPSRGRTWTQPPSQAPKAPAAALPMSDDNEAEENEPSSTSLVEESVAVALDSEDPYRDFRASMQEMVAAHGLRDWAALQEMLLWYLRINGKHNHALIVGAFVDLLVGLATNTTSATAAATTTTTTTTATMTTTAAKSSSSSSSSSSTSSSGGDVTTCSASVTPANLEEQCSGGTDSSSSSASSDQEEDDPVVEELKASEGHCTNSALDSFCS